MSINLKKLSLAFLLIGSSLSQTVYGGRISIDDPENKKTPFQRLQVLIEDPEQMEEVSTLIKSNNIKGITNFVNKYWQEFHDRVSVRQALDHLEKLLVVDGLLDMDSFNMPFFAATALKEIMNERASLMMKLTEKAEEDVEKREFLLKVMEYKDKERQYLHQEHKALIKMEAEKKERLLRREIEEENRLLVLEQEKIRRDYNY